MNAAPQSRRPSGARLAFRALAVSLALAGFVASPAHALSAEQVALKALDLLGKSGLAEPNDIEMLKFSVKRPACAETIFTTTLAQDYSLIATVIGMKTAKVGQQVSVKGLQSFDHPKCRALSPLQRFYTFADRTGNRFLPDASYLKNLAKQQMDQGKSELEGALAKVPVAGPVILNWQCLCDAAFETQLSEENIAKGVYQQGAKLVSTAKYGSVGDVIEVALAEFGAQFACVLGTEYSGMGQVPIVGKATLATCSTVLGKTLAWGVKGAETVWNVAADFGETLSGQEQHMPPEKYFETFWLPFLHADALATLRGGAAGYQLTGKACVGYFDSHKASKSSAEKWCGQMHAELKSRVKALVEAAKSAVTPYFESKLLPKVEKLALDHYHAIEPQNDFLATSTFNPIWSQCRFDLSQAIPIKSPLPGKHPNITHYTSGPQSYWEWICYEAKAKLGNALYAYKTQVLPQAIKLLAGAGCTVKPASNKPALHFSCGEVAGLQTCMASTKTAGAATGYAHCGIDPAAFPKLAQDIAASLGAKRCKISAGTPRNVECTRPWKYDQCKALVQSATQGVQIHYASEVTCTSLQDPQFVAGSAKAAQLRAALPSAAQCAHGFDPLATRCFDVKLWQASVSANASLQAPACASDANKDGADAPCYSMPFLIGQQGPGALAAGEPSVPAPGAAPKPVAGRTAPGTPAPSVASVARKAAHHLVSDARLELAGQPASFGGTLGLDATKSNSRRDGVCLFPVRHTVRNNGTAASDLFVTTWRNSANGDVKRTWLALPAGGSASHVQMIALRPGRTTLELQIYETGRTTGREARGGDMQLVVDLRGDCGAPGARAASPTVPMNVRGAPPAR